MYTDRCVNIQTTLINELSVDKDLNIYQAYYPAILSLGIFTPKKCVYGNPNQSTRDVQGQFVCGGSV